MSNVTTERTVAEVLGAHAGELVSTWYQYAFDGMDYTDEEKAELILDRAHGDIGDIVEALISDYGYEAVHSALTDLLSVAL